MGTAEAMPICHHCDLSRVNWGCFLSSSVNGHRQTLTIVVRTDTVALLDQVSQLLPRQEDAAFHRADWNFEVAGNLLVLIALVEHQERYAIDFANLTKYRFVLFHADVHLTSVGNDILVLYRKQKALNRLIHIAAQFLFAVLINKGVAHDG